MGRRRTSAGCESRVVLRSGEFDSREVLGVRERGPNLSQLRGSAMSDTGAKRHAASEIDDNSGSDVGSSGRDGVVFLGLRQIWQEERDRKHGSYTMFDRVNDWKQHRYLPKGRYVINAWYIGEVLPCPLSLPT